MVRMNGSRAKHFPDSGSLTAMPRWGTKKVGNVPFAGVVTDTVGFSLLVYDEEEEVRSG